VSDIDSLIRERLDAAAALDVEADPQRVRENVTRRQRRIRRRRRTKVLVAALAAAGVTVGVVRIVDQDSGRDVAVRATDAPTAPSDDADTPTGSTRFLPAPGWEISDAGLTAANVRLGPNSQAGAVPWDTVERLDDGDVVLFAMVFPARYSSFPRRTLPLSLDDAQPGGLEGQPDDIYADRLTAQVNGRNIDLLIFYGGTNPTGLPPYHTEPSATARAAAQEQLARLVVPAGV
jgi:hypothetical protein